MISTFVAALLTLRTNQGLDRLIMGRNSLGNMVFFSRDAAMLFSTYIYPKDEQLGLKAARLLSLFGWALHSHIRDISQIDVIRAILPARNMNASFKYVTRQRKAPVALLSMLRQIVCETSKSRVVSTTESRLIEQCISGLNKVIMKAEKIRSTPIPPVYSAHATRLMMFYLGCLPWALLGLNLNDFASLAMTMVVGFAMLGLDEISHIFEQPFRFMPLYQLAKVSMLDVADAFCCRPPPISADYCEDESIEDKEEPQEPTYWKGLNGSIPYYKPASKRKNPLWKNA
jgi:putative membrane protein